MNTKHNKRWLINWFNRLSKTQQVLLVGPIISAIIGGILYGTFSIITIQISKEARYSNQNNVERQIIVAQEDVIKEEYKQHPEVKRINTDIFEYIKQIDKKTNFTEKQRLIDIVLEQLMKSSTIDKDDGETWFLLAEIYLRNNDYSNAIMHYDKALSKQYFYDSAIYLGYGIVYEIFGDQFISNNDLTSANVYYTNSIKYLDIAIKSQNIINKDNEEINNILARVKFKKGNYEQAEEYFVAFSVINKDSNNINNINQMIDLANNYADMKLWKNAVMCYSWLFKQNTTGQRRLGIIRDFQYLSNRWEFSDDFKYDISISLVNGIINSDKVSFRHEPTINDNTIREFKLFEEVKILQQSDFRQSIGNVRTYWYKICTDDGIEGWVYGQYLMFRPNFTLN
jgi:tetratricopeptide (TPR) repeat protein